MTNLGFHNSIKDAYISIGANDLQSLPNSWKARKLGSLLKPVSIKNRPDLQLLSITREQGVIVRDTEDAGSNHNFIPDDLSGYKVLQAGQFGMNKMKAWQGSYGISKHTGIVSPAYFIFDFLDDIEPAFFNWAIRSKLYVSFFGQASDGVRIGQWDLSKSRMNVIPFLYPSKSEQTAIANFLDDKTEKIERAIAIKEKQIELLKERKQILIQNAVTRGLNPDAPMKDSGVDWIGEIPAHWEVVSLNRIVDVRDGTHDTPEYLEEGAGTKFLITSKDFVRGEICFEAAKHISNKDHLEISKRSAIQTGDVLMSMIGGNIGKAVIVGEFSDFSVKNVALFRCLGNIELAKYILLYLVSGLLEIQVKLNSNGGAQDFLSLSNVRNLKLPLIPMKEIKSIVSSLELVVEKIDDSVSIIEEQIQRLKEYKASLINSAVTGKIKVPA